MLVKFIEEVGFILGIKVDVGVKDLFGVLGEKVMEGLDGLCECLSEYYEFGVCFVKWCVVIDIGCKGDEVIFFVYCLNVNVYVLVRYVVLC